MSEQEVEALAEAEGEQPDVVLIDLDLHNELTASLSWLLQMLAQIAGQKPWTYECDDPMGMIRAIDNLRPRLEAYGYHVPAIADPETDPLGNMIGWRDYLLSFMPAETVH